MKKLKFEVEGHKYFLVEGEEKKEIPSVHAVLIGDKKMGSSEAMRKAAERGQEIHTASELFLAGREDAIAFSDPMYNLYWKGLREYLLDMIIEKGVKVVAVEKRGFFEDGNIAYAGTADIIVELHGVRVGIDIKTSKVLNKDNCAQQAAYEQINGYDRSYLLHVGEDFCKLVACEDIHKNYKADWQNRLNAYFGEMTLADFIEADTELLLTLEDDLAELKLEQKRINALIKDQQIKIEECKDRIRAELKGNSAKTPFYSVSYSKGKTTQKLDVESIPATIQEQYLSFDLAAFNKADDEVKKPYIKEIVGKSIYRFTKIKK